jgi:hypothetical protein
MGVPAHMSAPDRVRTRCPVSGWKHGVSPSHWGRLVPKLKLAHEDVLDLPAGHVRCIGTKPPGAFASTLA